MLQTQPMTKSARRRLSRTEKKQGTNFGLVMRRIKPLTINQSKAFKLWENGQDLVLHGIAGSGKTLLAFFFGLKSVIAGDAKQVIIVRSAVPSRDLGFLPGSVKDKSREFELPYYEICATLFGRDDAYEVLKAKGDIQFVTTSYLRGTTLDNSVIIVDEFQNMAWNELNTVMTRVGQYTRVIFTGDTKQSDLEENKGKRDVLKMIQILKQMDCFEFVNMKLTDVVRSGKAKEYLTAVHELGF